MTLDGLTALSVEICTMTGTPAARQASATWRVPSTLVRMPSAGCASTMGTCFSAAAWNTSSGRASANTDSSARLVADVGEHGLARQGRVTLGKRQIDLVEMEFRILDQGDLGRLEVGDLAHQLAADGAAGAGHHDALAGDERLHGRPVEHRLGPAEQVLDRDRSDLGRDSPTPSRKSVSRGRRASAMPSESATSSSARTTAPSMCSLVRIRRCGFWPRASRLLDDGAAGRRPCP